MPRRWRPTPGPRVPCALLTNEAHDAITTDLRYAEAALSAVEAAHQATPARLPLNMVNPGQQVLDAETKLITHTIRIAAFNTATTLARELRDHSGYASANPEAHTLIRQVPTRRATNAIGQLCEHSSATRSRLPRQQPDQRYEIETGP